MILVLGKSALFVPDTRFSRVSGSTLIFWLVDFLANSANTSEWYSIKRSLHNTFGFIVFLFRE